MYVSCQGPDKSIEQMSMTSDKIKLGILYTSYFITQNVRKHFFGHVHPGKIHINLVIWEVWSESSVGAFRTA